MPARWGRCPDGFAKRAHNPRGCVKGGSPPVRESGPGVPGGHTASSGPGPNPAGLKGLADKRPGWGIGGFPVRAESAEEPEKRGKRHRTGRRKASYNFATLRHFPAPRPGKHQTNPRRIFRAWLEVLQQPRTPSSPHRGEGGAKRRMRGPQTLKKQTQPNRIPEHTATKDPPIHAGPPPHPPFGHLLPAGEKGKLHLPLEGEVATQSRVGVTTANTTVNCRSHISPHPGALLRPSPSRRG